MHMRVSIPYLSLARSQILTNDASSPPIHGDGIINTSLPRLSSSSASVLYIRDDKNTIVQLHDDDYSVLILILGYSSHIRLHNSYHLVYES